MVLKGDGFKTMGGVVEEKGVGLSIMQSGLKCLGWFEKRAKGLRGWGGV